MKPVQAEPTGTGQLLPFYGPDFPPYRKTLGFGQVVLYAPLPFVHEGPSGCFSGMTITNERIVLDFVRPEFTAALARAMNLFGKF